MNTLGKLKWRTVISDGRGTFAEVRQIAQCFCVNWGTAAQQDHACYHTETEALSAAKQTLADAEGRIEP